ncbi:hypothetical protein [Streptococcus sobrinus]|uniref:hypothetical protein n=1 Tax=Streptococcus sobrinus TaxID=1310 RepID=UPI0002D4B74B|nr:hypothetical protein [Streptococcus sobrinus]
MDSIQYQKMKLADFRQLGKEGGAFAYLSNGKKVSLKAKLAEAEVKILAKGQVITRKVYIPYHQLYSKVKFVTRHHQKIATLSKDAEGNNYLKLTGDDYRRPVAQKG